RCQQAPQPKQLPVLAGVGENDAAGRPVAQDITHIAGWAQPFEHRGPWHAGHPGGQHDRTQQLQGTDAGHRESPPNPWSEQPNVVQRDRVSEHDDGDVDPVAVPLRSMGIVSAICLSAGRYSPPNTMPTTRRRANPLRKSRAPKANRRSPQPTSTAEAHITGLLRIRSSRNPTATYATSVPSWKTPRMRPARLALSCHSVVRTGMRTEKVRLV